MKITVFEKITPLHTAVKTKNSRINLFFAVIHFVELVRSVYNEYN